MNDPDDKKLKAEIDEIMKNVHNILKKSKALILPKARSRNKMRIDKSVD